MDSVLSVQDGVKDSKVKEIVYDIYECIHLCQFFSFSLLNDQITCLQITQGDFISFACQPSIGRFGIEIDCSGRMREHLAGHLLIHKLKVMTWSCSSFFSLFFFNP